MKILVVSEVFSRGGLETQIKTYYDNLPQDTEMVFAFSKYTGVVLMENAKIYTGFHFCFNDTVSDFCDDVQRLIEIIETEKIDVIHAHPFRSFFAALFASQLTNIKLVYTYHGLESFNFVSTNTTAAVFKYAFEIGAVAKLFSVSNRGVESFKKIGYNNSCFMPNPIDIQKYKKAEYIKNKKWAIISRLDVDKISEIKLVLLNLEKYGIENIDIYGSGSCTNELEDFINEHKLSSKVKYMGYCSDLYGTVHQKYNGIIGIGRVVLEGLAMGMPVLLIGYSKISGFVNTAVYNEIKGNNFSNYGMNIKNAEMPEEDEIKSIQQDVYANMSSSVIVKQYLDLLSNAESVFSENLRKMYYKIKSLAEDEATKNVFFTTSREVYGIARIYIGSYTADNSTNNLFTSADFCYSLKDELFAYFSENIQQIYNSTLENQQLKKQIANLEFIIEENRIKQQQTEAEVNRLMNLVNMQLEKIWILQNAEDRRANRIYRRAYRKIKKIFNK